MAGGRSDDAICVSSRAATKADRSLGRGPGLESSEAVFRALAAHTPLGIFVSDVDGRCLYVNDRWCELAGMTPAEALGDGWAAAIHPDDAERLLAEWADASLADRDSTVEYRFQRPDGGVSWIQGFASALRDDGGHVTGWVGSCLDTTTRRRAEEAAAESSVRFQAAFDSAPNGVALTAPDGSWLDVNDALCKLTGYSKDELLVHSFAEITHPDDRALSQAGWVRHSTGATDSNSIEKRYVRADGTIVWVEVSRVLVRNADGQPLYTVAHIADLTTRRDAERSLVEAEERFRRAFDDAPIGMALVGLGGRWLQTNESLCEILGYSAPDMLELNFQELTHPDDLDASSEWVRRLVAGELRSFSHEKRYLRRDGSYVWASLSVSLVHDAAGEPLYFVAQIQDVEERKLAEAEAARLLELERDQVERLEELDALKDEFVASVSHELRTPLTSIQGYLELVLDGDPGELSDEQRQHLTTVSRNSERLLRLVSDLLFVAQTDAGKLELIVEDVDLARLARESVESARPPAAAKGIRLEVSADELPLLRGDRARLAQLLDNLVSNALKFTLDGGSVTVSLVRAGDNAVLEVRDTGIGIPSAEQAQLFERFFRTRGATERAIPGTGLGLSIVRTIAESHGGSIGFESVEGTGTVFRVELPL
jgi:PAS domain S-box-containing protein